MDQLLLQFAKVSSEPVSSDGLVTQMDRSDTSAGKQFYRICEQLLDRWRTRSRARYNLAMSNVWHQLAKKRKESSGRALCAYLEILNVEEWHSPSVMIKTIQNVGLNNLFHDITNIFKKPNIMNNKESDIGKWLISRQSQVLAREPYLR